jgi:hypothetical protein
MIESDGSVIEFDGLLEPSYQLTDLTPGANLEFKVQSRNAYSSSDFSDSLLVLFVFKPDAPIELMKDVEVSNDEQIKITWKEG